MPDRHMRAADADRAALAAVLGEHMSAGRLTLAEYDERLARAYAATTYGELEELIADLPSGRTPATTGVRPVARPRTMRGPCGEDAWRSWAATAVVVLTIWAITSLAAWQLLYFWPAWVIGPWGALLLAQRRPRRRRDRPRRSSPHGARAVASRGPRRSIA